MNIRKRKKNYLIYLIKKENSGMINCIKYQVNYYEINCFSGIIKGYHQNSFL